MKLVWTPQAIEDRQQIYAFIFEYDAGAADALDDLFVEQATALLTFPDRAREGRVSGTRELVVHRHYLLVYAHDGTCLTILAVLHTSRQYPPLIEG